ncbi:hypothetical protein GCK32_002028 [Trichostrongylus colubriformis]|uniref:Uncharacterized protein n=1 Tax=Trichostrongylus colubriformis TaxID=6319 RepID=A0AAN8FJQ9_TRICO
MGKKRPLRTSQPKDSEDFHMEEERILNKRAKLVSPNLSVASDAVPNTPPPVKKFKSRIIESTMGGRRQRYRGTSSGNASQTGGRSYSMQQFLWP